MSLINTHRMAFRRRPSLILNCGYARACVYVNSDPKRRGRNARRNIDTACRSEKFLSQFGSLPTYGIPEEYLTPTGRDHRSQLDRDSNKILDGFDSRFRGGLSREAYLTTFSLAKWSELAQSEKEQHTLSSCKRCFEQHEALQCSFPPKPVYHPEPVEPVVTVDEAALERQGVRVFTANIVSELNRVYSSKASTSFADALVQDRSLRLVRKKTSSENRKEKRAMQRVITQKVNQCFAENAAISMLTEGESKRKYHRKRLAQSYCSPEEPPAAKRNKTHSPNFDKVAWDTEALRVTLENWPRDTTINWSAVGRSHGIAGGNAGQVVKEFAKAHDIDLNACTPKRKPTRRPCKKRLPGPGFDASIPSNPTLGRIEAEIQDMISSGRFSLGEECAPYKVTKYVMENGHLTPHDTFVQARKVPLKQIRQRLLDKHLKYMRLTPSVEVKRSLCMWHDHATILKMGFIMVTVHIMYDPLVFFTDDEFQQTHPGTSTSIQAEVEQPEIYLLSAGSSCAEDQAALVGERISCLMDLTTPIQTEGGVTVRDILRFFTGDHPAAQFEQGSKQGGTYKCGACGCKEFLFNDQAHTLFHDWRPLKQLQSLATGGTFGKHAGILRPFDKLKVDELKRELAARGVYLEMGVLKDELQVMLDNILRGVIRVPALLLINPTQSLASLGLERYEVVASEPLHDLKGHIINLIVELPLILRQCETTRCAHLIDCCLSKEKKSGADLRRVVIQIYLLLKDLDFTFNLCIICTSIVISHQLCFHHCTHSLTYLLTTISALIWSHHCLWNWALQGPWLVSGIGHSRDLGLSLELGTPGTLACLWNWALQGPWLVSGIGHSRDLGLSLELGTPGTLACLWNWALQGPWLVSGIGHSRDLALTAALTLQVCPDWSWQQSTGQAHTSLSLLLSLCKCVLTGPGNRVLVRHTPRSHCCSHSASVS